MKIASLDAEKAFDKVWREGMFYKLIDKINPILWVLLYKYYESSKGIIQAEYSFSDSFDIICGVKQGGILSPFLFNVFIDDLISECIEKNIGASLNDLNVSLPAYTLTF